jgi:hypothetical protein
MGEGEAIEGMEGGRAALTLAQYRAGDSAGCDVRPMDSEGLAQSESRAKAARARPKPETAIIRPS